MLTHLSIQNFTLVDHLDLDFKAGMTVITGETGAGKSILLDALGQALGDRADGQRVRSGTKRADRSEEHTSELQSRGHLVCRLLLEKKKITDLLTRHHV